MRLPGPIDLWIALRFGAFSASRLPEDADLLVGWSGASLEAIEPAKRLGMKVVIERGSLHIDAQTEILRNEYDRWNLDWRATDPRLIERERAEYEAADRIAVGSRASAHSFVERGIPPERLIVNPYGALPSPARPAPKRREDNRPIRILFVGQVGLRKGVPVLLQAFAKIRGCAELHLIGPMEPGFEAVLRRLPREGVVFRGPMPGRALTAEYAGADLFCLPSLEEGFGMVILEAMAAGCPVVASTATGLADICARDPEAGLPVPPGDPEKLAAAFAELIEDADRRRRMAERGLTAVSAGFSWADYGARAVEAYQGLLRRT